MYTYIVAEPQELKGRSSTPPKLARSLIITDEGVTSVYDMHTSL
jgi:hypothetical protein